MHHILLVNSHGYYNFQQAKSAVTILGWPLNLCRVPEQQCLYGTYVSDVTGNQYHIAITCLQKLMASLHLHNHCKNQIRNARGQFIGIMCSIWTVIKITHV